MSISGFLSFSACAFFIDDFSCVLVVFGSLGFSLGGHCILKEFAVFHLSLLLRHSRMVAGSLLGKILQNQNNHVNTSD